MKQTLYLSRPLLNGYELHTWAKNRAFSNLVPSENLQVTIAYSRRPIDAERVIAQKDNITIFPSNAKIVKFGDHVVFKFDSDELSYRWMQIYRMGASWDFAKYEPHVTFAAGILGENPAPKFPLIFGSERIEEIIE